jgi:hypothetical protein
MSINAYAYYSYSAALLAGVLVVVVVISLHMLVSE